MNRIKQSIKYKNVTSSVQSDFQGVRVLNGIKINIHNPLDAQKSEKQLLTINMMNADESIKQMAFGKLGQTCCIPILTKIGFQELKISHRSCSQQPFQELKKSLIASQTTKVSNNTSHTFANDANHTFDGSMQVSFCCCHNIKDNPSIHDHKKPEKEKREIQTDIIRSEKNVSLEQNISEVSFKASTQSSQKQRENRLKQERKLFDFKSIAGKLRLSSQYQNIQAIKKGKEETQQYQADLQRRKIKEESRKKYKNNVNQSSFVQKQLFVSPIIPQMKQKGMIQDKIAKFDQPKTTKKILQLTIGEKYGVTNKKMFDVIQEEIDQDMKEALLSQKNISYIQELIEKTHNASSQPSDQDLIKLLRMRNLIRNHIMLMKKRSKESDNSLLY